MRYTHVAVAVILGAVGCGSADETGPARGGGATTPTGSGSGAGAAGGSGGSGTGTAPGGDGPGGGATGGQGGGCESGGQGAGVVHSRGIQWVRDNPMFISGLVVTMPSPSAGVVQEYLDDFNANAIHLWATGLPGEMDGWRAGAPGTPWVAWLMHNGASAANGQVIGGYPAGAADRIGYQIGDEPLDMADLLAMEAGANAARQADPDALIWLNFNTAASEAMLTYYGEQMDCDLISYDRYTRNQNSYEHRELIREYGLRYDMPYWRYIKAYTTEDHIDIAESDMRWDAFAGLTYGYTGHTWFLYQKVTAEGGSTVLFTETGDYSSPKTDLYAVAAQVNVELRNLGRCITQLTSTDVRYISSVPFAQPPRTTTWAVGAGGDPYLTGIAPAPGESFLDILAGFFVDDFGERYAMVQNVRHQHGSWPNGNSNAGTIRLSFDFDGAPASLARTHLQALDKLTGNIVDLPLTTVGGEQAQVDVPLAAGDALLFKYATGRCFTLGP